MTLDGHPPPATGRTRRWVTALVLLAAAVCFGISCFAALVIRFGASTTCHEAASADVVRHAELVVLVAVLVLATPWVLAGVLARRWWVGLLALVAAGPLVVLLVIGLDPGTWSGAFCF